MAGVVSPTVGTSHYDNMLPVRPLLMVGLHKNLCRFYMTNNYPLNNEYGPEGAMAGYVHWTSFQTFLDLVVYRLPWWVLGC